MRFHDRQLQHLSLQNCPRSQQIWKFFFENTQEFFWYGSFRPLVAAPPLDRQMLKARSGKSNSRPLGGRPTSPLNFNNSWWPWLTSIGATPSKTVWAVWIARVRGEVMTCFMPNCKIMARASEAYSNPSCGRGASKIIGSTSPFYAALNSDCP